jgi:hypothetical protein
MLKAWEEHKTNTTILRYLAQIFISNTDSIALLNTVYVLPQVKVVEGLAILFNYSNILQHSANRDGGSYRGTGEFSPKSLQTPLPNQAAPQL